ncbi:hypothetical protein P3X46_002998 [Hevea brasiliensis]|uniref:Glycine-rich protein n=1 Tax=Hevea brasiliensis TaxID=3981 RepID=A0ABQ9N5K7_HEVBR|nr:uncharacterized protein LOC110648560 [Hevea brasiliensis]KAJ9187556.1 hypothetical protein P3X46_002998 [Hevea brasiliensis]
MAATAASEVTEGPVLSFINKRLRALRKKYNRILQMEESISQGKPINKEQEDVLRSKPSVYAAIEELEKLRQPLATAVSEEIALALQSHQQQSSISDNAIPDKDDSEKSNCESDKGTPGDCGYAVEDLLNLLYFGTMFDVKSQNDFTATLLTRTHERGCCLTYDYVTDDATDLLGERDLDMISKLGGLLISRPVDSSLSHKNALHRCIEHAKLWLANSDQPIEPNANATYAQLRERLNKIMASDYFTTTPEMKAPVEVAAAAAAGNYASFQVPVHRVPISVPVQVEGSVEQYEAKDEDTAKLLGHETSDNLSSPDEELQKDELETEIIVEEVYGEQEQARSSEIDHNQKEVDPKEQQHFARRNYQNQRGSRSGGGGGRRGFSNGRGRGGGGRGGGGYQNGRSQYYEQSGNYYPRNYYNNRGRGGRGGGGHPYNNHGSAVQGGHGPVDVGVAS